MAVTVGGGGLAGEKSTAKYNAEWEGRGYVFQSNAAHGPTCPDGAPSISSLFPPYMFFVFVLTFRSAPTSSPNPDPPPHWHLHRKRKTPAMSPWQRQASGRRGIGEMPSPHQNVLQILATVSQKPWAASRPSLDCDTLGWCVLPWGCWTSHRTRCSGAHSNVYSPQRKGLWCPSLYARLRPTVCDEQVAGSS